MNNNLLFNKDTAIEADTVNISIDKERNIGVEAKIIMNESDKQKFIEKAGIFPKLKESEKLNLYAFVQPNYRVKIKSVIEDAEKVNIAEVNIAGIPIVNREEQNILFNKIDEALYKTKSDFSLPELLAAISNDTILPLDNYITKMDDVGQMIVKDNDNALLYYANFNDEGLNELFSRTYLYYCDNTNRRITSIKEIEKNDWVDVYFIIDTSCKLSMYVQINNDYQGMSHPAEIHLTSRERNLFIEKIEKINGKTIEELAKEMRKPYKTTEREL